MLPFRKLFVSLLLHFSLLLLLTFSAKAQRGLSLSAVMGTAINPTLDINGEQVKNTYGFLFHTEATYTFTIYKKLYGEAGLATRLILSSGEIDNISYNAQTLRVQMPLKLGCQITQKWTAALGVAFQNSKDVLESDFRERYFWRPNLVAEAKYFWTKKWFIKGSFNYLIRNLPEGYLVNDPKVGLLFGIGRHL
ncbi:MAG: outer membrane beta-barrel protein [Saprospiraceae bacterium]